MSKGIISKYSASLKERHGRGGLSFGVGIEDNFQRHPLSHQRHLEELVPQVNAHDLCLG